MDNQRTNNRPFEVDVAWEKEIKIFQRRKTGLNLEGTEQEGVA